MILTGVLYSVFCKSSYIMYESLNQSDNEIDNDFFFRVNKLVYKYFGSSDYLLQSK